MTPLGVMGVPDLDPTLLRNSDAPELWPEIMRPMVATGMLRSWFRSCSSGFSGFDLWASWAWRQRDDRAVMKGTSDDILHAQGDDKQIA
eukprot:350223-Chlamydomonas_euryale.AAC.2